MTDDLIGKPWRLGARGPDAFDCWGVVLELARRAGRPVPPDWRSEDLTRAEQRALMAGESLALTEQLAGPADGAIAYSRRASHVGYVLHGRVIHSARGAGVVASSLALWALTYPDRTWHSWRG